MYVRSSISSMAAQLMVTVYVRLVSPGREDAARQMLQCMLFQLENAALTCRSGFIKPSKCSQEHEHARFPVDLATGIAIYAESLAGSGTKAAPYCALL